MLRKISLPVVAVFLCAFIGIAIQIQMSIGQSQDSIGLRVNLGDLALPFAGILILGTLAFRKSIWPRWKIPLGLFWPIALSCLLCFAMWNGHHITGTWSQWAIVNKFVGWFVLMAYFCLGAWITTNFGETPIRIFLKIFLLTCTVVSIAHLIYLMLPEYGVIARHAHYQHTGLMGNRNAMGFSMVAAFSLMIVYQAAGRLPIHPKIYYGFLALLPLLAFYNESRAFWIAIIVPIIGALALYRMKGFKALRTSLVVLALGLSAILTINHFDLLHRQSIAHYQAFAHESILGSSTLYAGDVQRLRVLSDSLEFWKTHPVQGIGLGSFLHLQEQKYADNPQKIELGIIDSTPLWILTELGLIGIVVMGGFYIVSIYTMNRSGSGETDVATLRRGVILMLLGFAAMSLFHELIYTRFIWFFLGLALAVSREELERVRANP